MTLALAPGLSNATITALLKCCGFVPAVLECITTGATAAQLRRRFGADDSLAEASLLRSGSLANALSQARNWCRQPQGQSWQEHCDWLQQDNSHLICIDDENYPDLLRAIQRPPWLLFAVGQIELLWQPQIAVVGSRNPSNHGLQQAQELAGSLSRSGLVITSGLAEGIDAAAHRAALQASGKTIAVMGTGVDRIYPASNRDLGREIAAKGLLLSEFKLGTEPRAGHFPARNRIISGLSIATVVVEAGLRSGSLITARLASEQGREVMAMPGSVRNSNSRGCHALIRDGARLVENAEQVLEDIAPLAGRLADHMASELAAAASADAAAASPGNANESTTGLDSSVLEPDIAPDEDYQLLWQALGFDPMTIDDLISHTGLTPESISSMLLVFELHGKVAADAAGWVRSTAAAHEVNE